METEGYQDIYLFSRCVLAKILMDNNMMHIDMSIDDIMEKYPEAFAVFEKYGLSCIGCRAALFETVGQAAKIHGIDADMLLEDLKKAINKE